MYSRDGDQLCSNAALVFAIIALCMGIVTQSTCSFVSLNPSEIVQRPNVWPPANIFELFPDLQGLNNSEIIELIENGTVPVLSQDIVFSNTTTASPQQGRRTLQVEEDASFFQQVVKGSDEGGLKQREMEVLVFDAGTVQSTMTSVVEELGLSRNISATNLTVNLGLWRLGIYQIDGNCFRMSDLPNPPPTHLSLKAARAMGILSSVAGGFGIILGFLACHVDDKSRRKRNKLVASMYLLASVSAWLMFLIYQIDECNGAEREWNSGPLEGMILLYGKCQCRAGCFITMVAGSCYLVSVITVLQYSG